jgi:type II secretory pathway predicted ATPase ExeA
MTDILRHYGLACQPFPRTDPDGTRRFDSADLKNALGVVRYTMDELGICTVYGDTGRGISYAALCASKSPAAANYTVKYIPCCHVCPRDMYKEACRVIGASPQGRGRQEMITSIREAARNLKQQGSPLFLILDRAQNLPDLFFRDLMTMLTENYGKENLMLLMLCGNKELKYRLNETENKDMYDSLAAHWEFRGFTEEECRAFVEKRLIEAGSSLELIKDEVLGQLYDLSGRGSCRELSNLMRDALLIGAQFGYSAIDMNVIRSAVKHREL